MMKHQKLNWALMVFLIPILILGLTACGGQSESKAAVSGEQVTEKVETETSAQAEETTSAEGVEEAVEVRQATTVVAATRMIDLNDLPLPDEAKLMGQPEAGSLRYQAPIEVAEAVEMYRSALTDQGWQEDTEAGHVESASAALFFKKEDFKLSLSAGDMGEGNTMVSLTNHGNIDLRTLPQMADAEELFNFPGSLGYVSSANVANVADFTRRELAAQGWHEYTRPNTAMSDDLEQQSFNLIQNGLELSASVGVAPAQGGKTAVQYGVSVLPLDLPVPADAAGLEFEKMLLNLSLSYTTPADFETLFDYYSREMTDLGWVVIDSIGMMTPERATLFFGNENVPPHTLVLDLIPSNGQTLATLRDYEADELTELNAPDVSSQTNEPEPMAGGEMPAIPIPDEAQDVAYDADLGEITYTTLSDAETVTEFYRQSISDDGWQADEDSVMANDVFVNITFERGEESINISSKDVSVPTRVTVNIRYAPSLTGEGSAATEIEANVGDTIEMGDFSFIVDKVTLPEETNYYQPFEGNKFLEILFTIENRHTSDTFDAFYLLWLSINDPDGSSYGYDELGFTTVDDSDDSYGSHNGRLAPDEQARGRIIFQVPVDAETLVFVVEAPDLGDDRAFVTLPKTDAPPTAGSGPDDSVVNIPSFLTPADAQDVVYDADLAEITYTTPSDVETAIEFYRQSLSAEGWQEDKVFSTVDENFALVMFNQGADSFNINVFSMDITEVTVDISFAPSLVEIIEDGTWTGAAPSDSDLLSLVEEGGAPVPSDYTDLFTMETPFAIIVTFSSPSNVDTLVELYKAELPGQGWEFIEYSLDGEVARLYFENGDQKLSIDLRVNDGEISPDLAGQTSVELSVKYPVAAAEAGILPPSGQAQILLINSAAVDLAATINQQDFELTPVPLSTEFPENLPSINLPPGQYTITISVPDGSVTSYDIEIGPDKDIAPGEAWALILDVGMSPMEWPVY